MEGAASASVSSCSMRAGQSSPDDGGGGWSTVSLMSLSSSLSSAAELRTQHRSQLALRLLALRGRQVLHVSDEGVDVVLAHPRDVRDQDGHRRRQLPAVEARPVAQRLLDLIGAVATEAGLGIAADVARVNLAEAGILERHLAARERERIALGPRP